MHREPPIPTLAIWRHLAVPLWWHHSRPMTMTSTTSPLCSSTYCSVFGGSIRSPLALRILISLLLTWFPAGERRGRTREQRTLHQTSKCFQDFLKFYPHLVYIEFCQTSEWYWFYANLFYRIFSWWKYHRYKEKLPFQAFLFSSVHTGWVSRWSQSIGLTCPLSSSRSLN